MNKATLVKLFHFSLTHLCIILFYWFASDTTIPIEEYEEEQIVAYLRTEASLPTVSPDTFSFTEVENCKDY